MTIAATSTPLLVSSNKASGGPAHVETVDCPPVSFCCAKTGRRMTDPVVSIYGHNYERETMVDWLASGNTTCPMTDKLLTSNDVVSNGKLRFRIQMWLHQQDNLGCAYFEDNDKDDEEAFDDGSTASTETPLTKD